MAGNNSPHLRSLSILLILVIVTLLLSDHAFRYSSQPTTPHFNTQPSSNADNGSNRTSHPLIPLHHRHHIPIKRAVRPEFQCLVAKGKKYWEEAVLPAFAGQSRYPPPDFGTEEEDPLEESGWTEEDELRPSPPEWAEVLEKTEGKVPRSDVHHISLSQYGEFENDGGVQKATEGVYWGWFIPENDMVIMYLTASPTYQLGQGDVAAADIPARLPRMHQLSDLVWLSWEGVAEDPGSLRYYAVQGVKNQVSADLIKSILQARRGTADVPWERRVTFDLNSEEGMALFGCPNGIAVNWLLIHHAVELGRREPRVTIYQKAELGEGGVMMVWDLVPVGKQGSFGDVER
ncbi:MAG: hypothetical protein Q9184_007019 [Pyrenodesmia sp. 2 TL-2023]